MARKNIPHMIVRQLSNPNNWTKKKFTALIIAVATALVGNYVHQNHNQPHQNGTAKKGQIYAAKVISVADGDTATVLDTHGAQHKIRFAYIDAPEKNQAHGIESKNALTKLIHKKNVHIRVVDIDRYQREVGVVLLNDLDVNYEQVKNGHAWHYQAYAQKSSQEYQQYANALALAKQNRIGLWRGKNPQQPWLYRAEKRQSAK